MKRFIFIFLWFLSATASYAQQSSSTDWCSIERKLQEQLNALVQQTSYNVRDSLNVVFVADFERALRQTGSFNYAFDSLSHVGRIVSDDGFVRLFTWNIPQGDGSQRFFGFVQRYEPKTQNTTTFALHSCADSLPAERLINMQLPHNVWFGALYYQIITVKSKTNPYYLLLGYRPNGIYTNKKIIEPLSFGLSGQPLFGMRVFNVDGKHQQLQRIIFEFSARASMALRFEPKMDLIVFDHLSPATPRHAGNAQFYGPDFSYDGFRLNVKTGLWDYVRDLDMRNPNKINKKKPTGEPAFIYRPNYKQREE